MISWADYDFDGRILRVIFCNDDAWVVFADVAAILGLKNPDDALNAISEGDKFSVSTEIGGKIVDTSAVYGIAVDEMLHDSDSPNADRLIGFLNDVVFDEFYGSSTDTDETTAPAQAAPTPLNHDGMRNVILRTAKRFEMLH